MPAGTGKSLGPEGVGILSAAEKLTQAGRDAFVNEVVTLLVAGNTDGKTLLMSKITKLPLMPIPGPDIVTFPNFIPTKEKLFWFGPEPFALLTEPELRKQDGIYQKIWLDGVYENLIKLFNVNGSWAPPIFDPTIFIPDFEIPKFPITPQFFIDFQLQIPDLIIKGDLPQPFPPIDIPAFPPKLPSLPALPFLDLIKPTIPNLQFDFVLPQFIIELFKIPLNFLIEFFPKLLLSLPPKLNPLELFSLILKFFVDSLFLVLEKLNLLLILPKLLIATVTVILKNVAAAMVVDLICLLLGTGSIAKGAGIVLGLA